MLLFTAPLHCAALVCFRNGAVVGRTGLLTFGPPEEVLEEMVSRKEIAESLTE